MRAARALAPAAAALAAAVVAVAARSAPAAADPPAPPRAHGSVGAGGQLAFGGPDRTGGAAALDVLPGGRLGRWGLTAAVRAVPYQPFGERGLATLGVIREVAAARPRLVLLLHGDVGFTWGPPAPAIGGGVKTCLGVAGPFGLAFDTSFHLVVRGVDGTHGVVGLTLLVALVH